MFLNLAQYFSMDRRTIAPILSNFRHFSMLLQFILKRGCLVNTFFVLIALKATLPTSLQNECFPVDSNVKIAKNIGPLRHSKKNLS
jgi:hypothetical protein